MLHECKLLFYLMVEFKPQFCKSLHHLLTTEYMTSLADVSAVIPFQLCFL